MRLRNGATNLALHKTNAYGLLKRMYIGRPLRELPRKKFHKNCSVVNKSAVVSVDCQIFAYIGYFDVLLFPGSYRIVKNQLPLKSNMADCAQIFNI